MENRRGSISPSEILFICAALLLLTSSPLLASTTRMIYSFSGGAGGEYLDSELVMDSAGNLYGTTVQGGTTSSGTVFQVTPSGVHTVLYNFSGGADGAEPYKGVTIDSQGNLYGTTVAGGSGSCESGCGVVYKLTNSGGTWSQSVIYAFTGGNDGAEPGSPVALDKHGNIYGTTPIGGANELGVVYQLKPDAAGGWTFHVIHTFTGGEDGIGGSAAHLLITRSGKIYGACTTGGAFGNGTVFEMSFDDGQWRFQTLYAFKGGPDGAWPYSGLVFDSDHNLYGTTYYGGVNGLGTVYKLSRTNGIWKESVLHSFAGGTQGDSPLSTLARDASGNLFGTASDGGAPCSCGVIYKMAQDTSGNWTYTVRYRFPGTPSLGISYNGMVRDVSGVFYGTTVHGGNTDDGAIYKFTP